MISRTTHPEYTLALTALYDVGEEAGVIDRWFGVFELDSENESTSFGLAMGERRGPQGVCYSVEFWLEENLGEQLWSGYLGAPESLGALPVPEGVQRALRNEFALFEATGGYTR